MAEEDGSVAISSDSWNVAEGYTKLKILKQLVLCDKLETIALYGTEDIDDILANPMSSEMITQRRVDAISRLKDTIAQLIGNVKFAIKSTEQDKVELLRGRLNIVDSMLDAICFIAEDQVSHQKALSINEDWFKKMLGEMQDIKELINFPINQAGLIFRASDSVNFDDLLKDIAQGG